MQREPHTGRQVGWTFSGGGFSHVFGKPAYQELLPAGSTAIGSMRGVPDIALQASAGTGALVYLTLPPDGLTGLICGSSSCNTGWYDIGGTSLCAPQWAGLVAIAARLTAMVWARSTPRSTTSRPIRPSMHRLLRRHHGRTRPTPLPGYPATTGWDPVTGLGTPNAANLLPDLVALVP